MLADAGTAFDLGTDMVEFRLDGLRAGEFEDVRELLEFRKRAIFTARPTPRGTCGREGSRIELLRGLARERPAAVDIELASARADPQAAREMASGAGRLVVSYHDASPPPDRGKMLDVYREAARYGRVVKMVYTARSFQDNLAVLELYREAVATELVAFCMGGKGLPSRIGSAAAGSPFAYASLPGRPAAPGQPSIALLKEALDVITL